MSTPLPPLETRDGLPDALRVLVDALPRDSWEGHGNFTELTRFWLNRHLMFRDVLGRLTTSTEDLIDNRADLVQTAHQTQRYAGFLLNELHGHHMIEDQHYFPHLQALDPRLERGFALLDADHHALDGHIHRLAGTTNAFLQAVPTAAHKDPTAELLQALTRFETFLDRHLTDEEDLVVPVILTYAPELH